MTPGGPPGAPATAPRGDLLNEVAAPQREPGDAVPSSGPRAGEPAPRGRSVDEDTRGVQQRMTTGMGWGHVMGYIYIHTLRTPGSPSLPMHPFCFFLGGGGVGGGV